MKKKVYYYHTDCGGVVYYGRYLEFVEEARTEFLAEQGVSVQEMVKEGTVFVVARQEIEYKLPAVYGDVLEIDTRMSKISGVKIEFDYVIKKEDNQVVAQGENSYGLRR